MSASTERVLHAVRDGATRLVDIAHRASLSESQTWRILAELAQSGKVQRVRAHWAPGRFREDSDSLA